MVEISYTATRRLVNTLGQQVSIFIDLETFDRSLDVKKSESKSIGGVVQSTLHYFTDTYSVVTTPIDPADRAEFDEFIYSTINNEEFLMIDIDDGSTLTVSRNGTHSRSRVTKAKLDYFTYSFNIRENV